MVCETLIKLIESRPMGQDGFGTRRGVWTEQHTHEVDDDLATEVGEEKSNDLKAIECGFCQAAGLCVKCSTRSNGVVACQSGLGTMI